MGNDDLQTWLDGLSDEERAEVVGSAESGGLSDSMQRSMQEAGLIDQGVQGVPDEVLQRLAEQGRGGPFDSPDGGKMRH
jgi:hypothetical protein